MQEDAQGLLTVVPAVHVIIVSIVQETGVVAVYAEVTPIAVAERFCYG